MALVHVRKTEVNEFGKRSWRLSDPSGVPISVFSEYCRKLHGLEYATRLRYTTVVARFIDYLYEVRVLGGPPVSRAVVNDSIVVDVNYPDRSATTILAGGSGE